MSLLSNIAVFILSYIVSPFARIDVAEISISGAFGVLIEPSFVIVVSASAEMLVSFSVVNAIASAFSVAASLRIDKGT